MKEEVCPKCKNTNGEHKPGCQVPPEWEIEEFDLSQIPSFPQRQDSLSDQLEDLYLVANKLGMYDAADYLKLLNNG